MTVHEDVDDEERRHNLWLFTVATLATLLFCQFVLAVVDPSQVTRSALVVARLAYAGLVAVVLAWVIVVRSRITLRMSTGAGLVLAIPLAVMYWYVGSVQMSTADDVDQFTRYHIAIMLMAALFPGKTWTVFGVATGFAVLAVARYHSWEAMGLHPVGAEFEPWATVRTWAAACIVIVYRWGVVRAEQRYRKARAAGAILKHLVLVSRALRDGINTPLQTIEAIAFIERKERAGEARSEALSRCVVRLRSVVEILNAADAGPWEGGDLGQRAEERLATLRATLLTDASLEPRQRR